MLKRTIEIVKKCSKVRNNMNPRLPLSESELPNDVRNDSLNEIDNFSKYLQEQELQNIQLKDILWSFGEVFEDDLPELQDEEFDILLKYSKLDIVRTYPQIVLDYIINKRNKDERKTTA